MSLRALLKGVRAAIQAAYSLDATGCDITPDGRPPPVAGQRFLAVHPGGLGNSTQNMLDERADLLVTITDRTGVAPWDRIGSNILVDDNGTLAKAEAVRVLINMSYDVIGRANLVIPGTAAYVAANGGSATVNGFIEPLICQGLRYLGPKGPDWFFAEGSDPAVTGVAVQLSFGRARRVQDVSTAT